MHTLQLTSESFVMSGKRNQPSLRASIFGTKESRNYPEDNCIEKHQRLPKLETFGNKQKLNLSNEQK